MKNTIIIMPVPLIIDGEQWHPKVFVDGMRHCFNKEFGREPAPEELASYANDFLKSLREEEIN